jgi:hypothetical protein
MKDLIERLEGLAEATAASLKQKYGQRLPGDIEHNTDLKFIVGEFLDNSGWRFDFKSKSGKVFKVWQDKDEYSVQPGNKRFKNNRAGRDKLFDYLGRPPAPNAMKRRVF